MPQNAEKCPFSRLNLALIFEKRAKNSQNQGFYPPKPHFRAQKAPKPPKMAQIRPETPEKAPKPPKTAQIRPETPEKAPNRKTPPPVQRKPENPHVLSMPRKNL